MKVKILLGLSIIGLRKHYQWAVIEIATKEQLLKIGWQVDNKTEFYSDINSYDQLMIVVDANTGEIISKEAMTAIHLDRPTSATVK